MVKRVKCKRFRRYMRIKIYQIVVYKCQKPFSKWLNASNANDITLRTHNINENSRP